VPDISLNAVANLGYAECHFLAPVYPGDTLSAKSEVIGVRENSSGDSGVVYVRTTGQKRAPQTVAAHECLTYVRWVMVRKRDKASPAPTPVVPKLADRVDPATLATAVPPLHGDYGFIDAGSPHRWAA
jgi:2-methylfumaryl-CoA hydratase